MIHGTKASNHSNNNETAIGNDLKIATAEEDTAGFYYSNNNAACAAVNNREAATVIDSPYFLNTEV